MEVNPNTALNKLSVRGRNTQREVRGNKEEDGIKLTILSHMTALRALPTGLSQMQVLTLSSPLAAAGTVLLPLAIPIGAIGAPGPVLSRLQQ
jgi:hypothetical protein